MSVRIFAITAIIVTLLSGCSTGPKYKNYQKSNGASITGDVANFFKFFSDGEAHVHIKEIDGIEVSSSPYIVSPGKHSIGVSAYHNYKTANEYISIMFESGRNYQLVANLRGISFVFKLLDITNDEPIILNEFKVKIGNESQPIMIPIMVPAN